MTSRERAAAAKLRRQILQWWDERARALPWRSTRNPFHALLAEVLLQKTPAWKVTPAYETIVARWSTPAALADVEVGDLASVIRPLGLISRTPRIKALAAGVYRLGHVPRSESGLLRLPGVARYIARAVRCFAFREPEPLVDGVSGRVFRRFFGLPEVGEPARDPHLWELAKAAVRRPYHRQVNWATLDLGAAICKPKKPRCWECPVADSCAWAAANYHPGNRHRQAPRKESQRSTHKRHPL